MINFELYAANAQGFELKRRGELKLIKVFQAEVFSQFLAGDSLAACYAAVAAVANRWLDMLDTQVRGGWGRVAPHLFWVLGRGSHKPSSRSLDIFKLPRLRPAQRGAGHLHRTYTNSNPTQGCDLTDEELISYISEATTMSKGLEEYEGRKSCPITCARRLGQFLGDERIRDKGLNCQYVIARRCVSIFQRAVFGRGEGTDGYTIMCFLLHP